MSSATAVKAPAMPAGLAPATTLRKSAAVVPAETGIPACVFAVPARITSKAIISFFMLFLYCNAYCPGAFRCLHHHKIHAGTKFPDAVANGLPVSAVKLAIAAIPVNPVAAGGFVPVYKHSHLFSGHAVYFYGYKTFC